jgi:hypothetical protein
MTRTLLLACVLCVPALAQVQLLVVERTGVEKPVSAMYTVPPTPVGERTEIVFRIWNKGQTALTIGSLTLGGSGFAWLDRPSTPHQLAPGFNVDFAVAFAPKDFGSYSANLVVNGVGLLITANSTAAPVLSAGGVTLSSGGSVDFGLLERGTSAARMLRLENTTSETVRVSRVVVAGKHFVLQREISGPFDLQPRSGVDLELVFAPTGSGVFEGSLAIDSRAYKLTGAANEPPMPKPTILVDLPEAASAQQGRVSVRFGEGSRAIGVGKLTMQFRSAAGLAADDDAVRFLRGGSRLASFEVTEGTTIPLPELTFQTGTTAGTIVFVAEVGGWTVTSSVEIPPQRVHIEKSRLVKNGSMLEVEITGFDNTRTVDALVFSFFSPAGVMVQPGFLRVGAAGDFQKHFAGSAAGGSFTLKAVFPVAGIIAEIASAEVSLTNAAGERSSGKFQ